ncbi:MAG: UvrB/UvrC motif-containing protein [Phycisphaerae bacterium]|nr:UvrB/UvrC motif-containing protein [Phycisphaerae bacterium]
MTLDLDELTQGWDCHPGELRARVVVGRDGDELIQLRIDLGVMQMSPDGRPDGHPYHGLPSTHEYIAHELRVGGERLTHQDWQELERELMQTNYRRLAYATLAEDALKANDCAGTRRYIKGALADIESCLTQLELLAEHDADARDTRSLRPTLVFDRARLLSQLGIVEGRFEEAIEHAEAGAARLDELLCELGYDEEAREEDPGVRYLRDLGRQLRLEYGVTRTLRERLEEALENEDFETAAEIREALRQRRPGESPAN